MAAAKLKKRPGFALQVRAAKITNYGYRRLLSFKNKDLALKYIQKGGKIPKIDAFMSLNQGALIKVLEDIEGARTAKPGKRGDYKDCRYLQQILTTVSKGTKMMFIERHDKFPEFYQFCIIGGTNVWIDISDFLGYLSIMKPPGKKKRLQNNDVDDEQ